MLRVNQFLKETGGLHLLKKLNHVTEVNIFCRKFFYKRTFRLKGVIKQFISCLFPDKHDNETIPDPTQDRKKTTPEYC